MCHIIARFVVDIQGQLYISTPKRNSGPFICHRPPPAPSPQPPTTPCLLGLWGLAGSERSVEMD